MGICDNKNQYTDYGSYLRTRGNNVDINKFIDDLGHGNFKFNNLENISQTVPVGNLPSLLILDTNGEMKTISSPTPATPNTYYTLKLHIDRLGKQTYSWVAETPSGAVAVSNGSTPSTG